MDTSDDEYFYRLWYPEAGVRKVIKVQKSSLGDLKTKLHTALRLSADVSVSYTLYVSDDDEWYECDEQDLPPKGKLKIETSQLDNPGKEAQSHGKSKKGKAKQTKKQSANISSKALQQNHETLEEISSHGRENERQPKKISTKRKRTLPKNGKCLSTTQNITESVLSKKDHVKTREPGALNSGRNLNLASDVANKRTCSVPNVNKKSICSGKNGIVKNVKSKKACPAKKSRVCSEQASDEVLVQKTPDSRGDSVQHSSHQSETRSPDGRSGSRNQRSQSPVQRSRSPIHRSRSLDRMSRTTDKRRASVNEVCSRECVLPQTRKQQISQCLSTDNLQMGENRILQQTKSKDKHNLREKHCSRMLISSPIDDHDECNDTIDDSDSGSEQQIKSIDASIQKDKQEVTSTQNPKIKPCYVRLTTLDIVSTPQRLQDDPKSKRAASIPLNSQGNIEQMLEPPKSKEDHSASSVPSNTHMHVDLTQGDENVQSLSRHSDSSSSEKPSSTCKSNSASNAGQGHLPQLVNLSANNIILINNQSESSTSATNTDQGGVPSNASMINQSNCSKNSSMTCQSDNARTVEKGDALSLPKQTESICSMEKSLICSENSLIKCHLDNANRTCQGDVSPLSKHLVKNSSVNNEVNSSEDQRGIPSLSNHSENNDLVNQRLDCTGNASFEDQCEVHSRQLDSNNISNSQSQHGQSYENSSDTCYSNSVISSDQEDEFVKESQCRNLSSEEPIMKTSGSLVNLGHSNSESNSLNQANGAAKNLEVLENFLRGLSKKPSIVKISHLRGSTISSSVTVETVGQGTLDAAYNSGTSPSFSHASETSRKRKSDPTAITNEEQRVKSRRKSENLPRLELGEESETGTDDDDYFDEDDDDDETYQPSESDDEYSSDGEIEANNFLKEKVPSVVERNKARNTTLSAKMHRIQKPSSLIRRDRRVLPFGSIGNLRPLLPKPNPSKVSNVAPTQLGSNLPVSNCYMTNTMNTNGFNSGHPIASGNGNIYTMYRPVFPPATVSPQSIAMPQSSILPPSIVLPPSNVLHPSTVLQPSTLMAQSTVMPPLDALPQSAILQPSALMPLSTAMPLSQVLPSSNVLTRSGTMPPSGALPQSTVMPSSGALPQSTVMPSSGALPQSTVMPLSGALHPPTVLPPSGTLPQSTILQPSALMPLSTALPLSQVLPSSNVLALSGTLPQSTLMPPSGTLPQSTVMPPSGTLPQSTVMPPSGTLPQSTILQPSALMPLSTAMPLSQVLPSSKVLAQSDTMPISGTLPQSTLMPPSGTLPQSTAMPPSGIVPPSTILPSSNSYQTFVAVPIEPTMNTYSSCGLNVNQVLPVITNKKSNNASVGSNGFRIPTASSNITQQTSSYSLQMDRGMLQSTQHSLLDGNSEKANDFSDRAHGRKERDVPLMARRHSSEKHEMSEMFNCSLIEVDSWKTQSSVNLSQYTAVENQRESGKKKLQMESTANPVKDSYMNGSKRTDKAGIHTNFSVTDEGKSRRISESNVGMQMDKSLNYHKGYRDGKIIATLMVRHGIDSLVGVDKEGCRLKQEGLHMPDGISHHDTEDALQYNDMNQGSSNNPIQIGNQVGTEVQIVEKGPSGKSSSVDCNNKQGTNSRNLDLKGSKNSDGQSPDRKSAKLIEKVTDKTTMLTLYQIAHQLPDEDASKRSDVFVQREERTHGISVDGSVNSQSSNKGRYSFRQRSKQVYFRESDDSEDEKDILTSTKSKKGQADENYNPANESVSYSHSSEEKSVGSRNTKSRKRPITKSAETILNSENESVSSCHCSDAQSVDEEVNEVLRRIKEAYQLKMEQHRLENEKREPKQSNTTITNQHKDSSDRALPLTVKDHNSLISSQDSILRTSVAPTCSTEIGSGLRCDSSNISVSHTNSFNSLDLLERIASDEHERMKNQHSSVLVSNLSVEWELKDVDAGEIDCSDKDLDKSSTINLIEDGCQKLDDSTSNEERLHEKSCDEKVTSERNNQVRYSLRRRSEQVKFLESDGSENEEDRFTSDMSNSESDDESFNPNNENVSETYSSDESASHKGGTKVSKGSKDAQNDRFGNGDIEPKQADVKVTNQGDRNGNSKVFFKVLDGNSSTPLQGSILKASENPSECTEIARCHSSNILAPIASESNTSQNDTKGTAAKKNCTEKSKDKVYELLCPDLEDKWEFMLGEKGTFERLQQLNVNHSLGYLTVHEDSEAFRKCFEYMEWNCKMRCIHCSQEFELFSDFLLHLFDRNSCEKTIKKKGVFVCIPCEKEGLARTRFIMHMMKAKSHGNLPSAFIPLSTENDEVGKGDDQGRLTSFSAGYRCKVCNNKQRFGLLTAAIDHIKEKHTKEKEKKYVYRKSNSKYGKTTVYAREAKTMYKVKEVDTSQGNGNERNVKQIINNPDIEDKWMFMFGEEGTFKQLKGKHTCTVNDLCIYEDSEAFRKFSEYMEWNARMRCIFCKQVFDQFSDFLIHFFDANSCEKLPVAVKHKFVCQPCGKFGLKKMSLIRHLLKLKSHGTKDAAYLPKLKDGEELDNGALETFKPGYTCKVCNDSRIWPTVRDGVHHIKVKHTNEIPLPAFFVKRTQKFTKGKVTIDAKECKRKAKHRLCKYCDKVCMNKKALLGHFAICHKDIANKGKAENSILEENDSLDVDENESTDEDECHRKIKERSKERSATYESRKKMKKRSKERSATYEGREKIKERSKERSATYESRENSSKDNAEGLYEVQRPDLEEKWEYMYGEKGTFKKLNGNHARKPLCVYDDSQAFRECFEYMEWNCRMRCIFCDQEFDLLADFLLHIFDLESCGKSIKARLRGYYACMPCGKDILTKEGMIRHMLKCETHGTKAAAFIPKTQNDEIVGGDNDQSFIPSFRTGFTCKVCKEPQIWPSLREAVIHIKDAHTLEKQRKFVYRKTIVEKGKVKICVQENQVRLTKCLCSYCGQVCRSQEALFAHLTSFHKEMAADQLSKEQLLCQHCGKEFSIHHKRAFDRHMGFHSGPMPCEICGKVLKNRNAYHRHKIRHKVKEYTCFCGKKFKKRFNYQQHKTHHRLSKEERRHKCDECDKSFIYKHHLTNHIASYHSTERKFKCTACGAKFKLKHHLKQHTDSESACAALLNDK